MTPEGRADEVLSRITIERRLWPGTREAVVQAIRAAVADEREAIAAMVESWPVNKDVSERILAAAIRARQV